MQIVLCISREKLIENIRYIRIQQEVLCVIVNGIVIMLSAVAVFMDLAWEKVDNQFILFGLILGFGYQIGLCGLRGAVIFVTGAGIPILFLYILFFFRMIGSGDIKLLSVLGGFIGPLSIAKCIFLSFLFGAVLSIFVIFICGNFTARLKYFTNYINRLVITKEFSLTEGVMPYYVRGKRMENIHFTVPVFMSMIVYAGGLLG